ncbi:MAG: hypothetical protein ACOYMY_13050, partial [Prochlorococcaceae cyanobacterium]
AAADASAPLIFAGGLVLDGLSGFGQSDAPITTRIHRLAGAVVSAGLFLDNQGDLAIANAADRSGSLSYPGLTLAHGGSLSSDGSNSLEGLLQSGSDSLNLFAADQLQLQQPARLVLDGEATASLRAQGGQLSSAIGSRIDTAQGSLQLSGNGIVLQGILNSGGRLDLAGGSAAIALAPYLSNAQKDELTAAGIDTADLASNLVLAGTISSAAPGGFSLQSDRLLPLLGVIDSTAPGAPLVLQTSSSSGMLQLGSLSSAGALALQVPFGRLYSGIPSPIRTVGGGALSILAAQASLNGPIEVGSGGVRIDASGQLSLAGATSSGGAVAMEAAAIDLAPSGGVVSLGDLSLAATGSGAGLRLAGLLLAGGGIGPRARSGFARRLSNRVALDGTTSLDSSDQPIQASDLLLDPDSNAELRLSSSTTVVVGGSSDGSRDTVVTDAWLAAPNVRITAAEGPRLLHDLIARDRLVIHSDSTLRLEPSAVLNLGLPAGVASASPTPEATLELTAPLISLPHDPADLVIDADSSIPQPFLAGNLSAPLTLAFQVTTPQGQTIAFLVDVAAGQRDSLALLLDAINRAVAEAARTAGVPNEAIPSLAMRGAVLRMQLGNELTLPEPDQLALVLVGARSQGLDQLGFSPSSTNRQGVIPATVLSHALATHLSAGSIDQPYQRLEWGGGVRADAASENTRLSW